MLKTADAIVKRMPVIIARTRILPPANTESASDAIKKNDSSSRYLTFVPHVKRLVSLAL